MGLTGAAPVAAVVPARPGHVVAALRAAAALGPYFAVEVADDDGAPGWRPIGDLGTDPALLTERVGAARSLLASHTGLAVAAMEQRVIASVWMLGLAARLLSPALATAALAGIVPELAPDRLRWQAAPAGPVPLRIAAPGGWVVAGDGAADVLHAEVVERLVRPLVAAVGRVARLAPPLLWGNVASALGGAVDALGRERPDRAEVAGRLAGGLLGRPPLAGTGELVRPDPVRSRWFFVRRTCCLYYRVPGGGLCGDCVLVPADVRARQWQDALDLDRDRGGGGGGPPVGD